MWEQQWLAIVFGLPPDLDAARRGQDLPAGLARILMLDCLFKLKKKKKHFAMLKKLLCYILGPGPLHHVIVKVNIGELKENCTPKS